MFWLINHLIIIHIISDHNLSVYHSFDYSYNVRWVMLYWENLYLYLLIQYLLMYSIIITPCYNYNIVATSAELYKTVIFLQFVVHTFSYLLYYSMVFVFKCIHIVSSFFL